MKHLNLYFLHCLHYCNGFSEMENEKTFGTAP